MTDERGLSARRLGIDARMLDAADGTGVSTYARTLLAAAALLDRTPVTIGDEGVRFNRFGRAVRALPPGARRLAFRAGATPSLAAPDIFRIAQAHFNLYGRLLPLRAGGPAGIMHWTYPVPLRLIGWRNVYTVHDAIPLDQPDLTPIDGGRHARLLQAIIRHAAALVTVSQAARSAILATTGCAPDRIVDCGQAAILPAAPPQAPEGFSAGAYFLFCGSIEPRKNLVRLAAAYRASGATRPLLLVGPDGWRAGEVMAAIGCDGAVRRLPYQGRDALLGLIGHARALLFPSLAEGFGLPVAEAMALGTPVMTSDGGAMAEIAGGGALLVDPHDLAGMAGAISRLERDDRLVAELSTLGRARARHFTLAGFAARLEAFYAKVEAMPRGGAPG